MSVSRRLGLEIKKKKDETHACVWSYLDFKRIEKAVQQNKKINAMRRPKNVLYSNAQEHPLVTDKRCLNLYYWPDVIPDCFKDMEEQRKMKSLLLKLRDYIYKQHCKKCSCYEAICNTHSVCHSEAGCKYKTWFLNEVMTKEELLAEEHICNGKCQDDITKNYVHCKTCTRLKDFLAGYKTGKAELKQDIANKKLAIQNRKADIERLEEERNDYRDRYESLKGEYAKLEEELVEADNATDCFNRQEEIIDKAKELIKKLLATPRTIYRRDEDGELTSFFNPDYDELEKQAEQFLKDFEICEDRLCSDCDQYDSCPDGKRCRSCDNGSKWKRKKE